MKTPLPTDLFNLKCQFESWRKTRTKRSRTPDHLLKAAADLLDQYPISTICRVCRINPRTLRRWNITSKNTSKSVDVIIVGGGFHSGHSERGGDISRDVQFPPSGSGQFI